MKFSFSGILLSVLVFIQISCRPVSSHDQPPNFVVFIADDLGWEDLGCYGNSFISTPHIDRIAREGIQFNNAFLTIAQCSPSRISILTGRYPHNTGAEDLHVPLPDSLSILPEWLKSRNYSSAILRKTHLGDHGLSQFDHYGPSLDQFSTLLDSVEHSPFFMWVGFSDPHRPYHQGIISNPQDPRQVKVPTCLVDDESTRTDLADYYNEIRRMDSVIGDFMSVLQARKLLERTVIIFLSDNGAPFPRAKGTVYDAGIKTPLLIRGPDIVPGVRRDELVSSIDLVPTLLELAGADPVQGLHGKSLAPMLSLNKYDTSSWTRKHVFAERNWHNTDEHIRCVRSTEYKLIENAYLDSVAGVASDIGGSPSWKSLLEGKRANTLNAAQSLIFQAPRDRYELYHLSQDPQELQNLANDPSYRPIKDQLIRQLNSWKIRTADFSPDQRRRPDNTNRHTGIKFWQVRVPDFLDEKPESDDIQ